MRLPTTPAPTMSVRCPAPGRARRVFVTPTARKRSGTSRRERHGERAAGAPARSLRRARRRARRRAAPGSTAARATLRPVTPEKRLAWHPRLDEQREGDEWRREPHRSVQPAAGDRERDGIARRTATPCPPWAGAGPGPRCGPQASPHGRAVRRPRSRCSWLPGRGGHGAAGHGDVFRHGGWLSLVEPDELLSVRHKARNRYQQRNSLPHTAPRSRESLGVLSHRHTERRGEARSRRGPGGPHAPGACEALPQMSGYLIVLLVAVATTAAHHAARAALRRARSAPSSRPTSGGSTCGPTATLGGLAMFLGFLAGMATASRLEQFDPVFAGDVGAGRHPPRRHRDLRRRRPRRPPGGLGAGQGRRDGAGRRRSSRCSA